MGQDDPRVIQALDDYLAAFGDWGTRRRFRRGRFLPCLYRMSSLVKIRSFTQKGSRKKAVLERPVETPYWSAFQVPSWQSLTL
jgi:hypothetical protein